MMRDIRFYRTMRRGLVDSVRIRFVYICVVNITILVSAKMAPSCGILLICLIISAASAADPQFLIGIGKADITGPAADVNMMGYAHPDQRTAGIHTRLYSRAFITCEINATDVCNVFVSADLAMGCTALNIEVFNQLSALGAPYDRYTEKNVVLSGTHSHSGPGGYLQYFTFLVTSGGFVAESHEVIVTGIIESIQRAHEALTPGNVHVNQGNLYDSNINRSPTGYMANPAAERAEYMNDTDTLMTVAKFVDENDNNLGLISWFAVHPVSMNRTNQLISGDNKGYASYLAEKEYGNGFVAAFANSNQGDVSPNIFGPKCIDTGLPCDAETSSCNGRAEMCIGSGPGKDMFESTKMIGERQYNKAKELYESASQQLSGPVGSIHQFVNMTEYEVTLEDQTKVKTCFPAMGYSFAGGTTDGPGFFTFTQGDTEGSRFWDFIRDLLKPPSEEMLECHLPKPVLLATGEAFRPYQWHPFVVTTQILRIGNLFINAVPGEFTTMAGRRLRKAVYQVLDGEGIPESDATVVITGLSNTYTHYITTPEEYAVQRYEAASTIYGQHEMQAFIQQFSMLAQNLAQGNEDIDAGPPPANLLEVQQGRLDPTDPDSFEDGVTVGDIYMDVDPKYRRGSVVTATFWAGNPRHNTLDMLENTFLAVEHQNGLDWETVYNDHDWCTRFYWESDQFKNTLPKTATVYWDIPEDQALGTYRLLHYGYTKSLRRTTPYDTQSSEFEVVSKDYVRP